MTARLSGGFDTLLDFSKLYRVGEFEFAQDVRGTITWATELVVAAPLQPVTDFGELSYGDNRTYVGTQPRDPVAQNEIRAKECVGIRERLGYLFWVQ